MSNFVNGRKRVFKNAGGNKKDNAGDKIWTILVWCG